LPAPCLLACSLPASLCCFLLLLPCAASFCCCPVLLCCGKAGGCLCRQCSRGARPVAATPASRAGSRAGRATRGARPAAATQGVVCAGSAAGGRDQQRQRRQAGRAAGRAARPGATVTGATSNSNSHVPGQVAKVQQGQRGRSCAASLLQCVLCCCCCPVLLACMRMHGTVEARQWFECVCHELTVACDCVIVCAALHRSIY
jgi:hypothetical protein